MKRLKCSILCVGMICNILFTGCSTEIKPDSKEEGVYATQNPLSAVEYSIYMNKQITVFTNQLTTRMIMANNAQESTYENEADMADESVKIMEDALEEVVVTYPSDTSGKHMPYDWNGPPCREADKAEKARIYRHL